MNCLKCGKEVMEGWSHCPFCGAEIPVRKEKKSAFDLDEDIFSSDREELEAKYKYCKNCGKAVQKDSTFCPQCKCAYFYETQAEWTKYGNLKFCAACGAENEQENVYCRKCGGESFVKYAEAGKKSASEKQEQSASGKKNSVADKPSPQKPSAGEKEKDKYWWSDQSLAVVKKAAAEGNLNAQLGLALKYLLGKGVGKSPEQAFYWKLQAAEQGNIDAQCEVANDYRSGYGCEKDYKKSLAWYRKIIEDHANSTDKHERFVVGMACSSIGKCYERGDGVKADYDESYAWYNKGWTEYKDENSYLWRRELKKKMKNQ